LTLVFSPALSLVGYIYRGRALTTAAGLRVGDTVARARMLYGHQLTISAVQGGAWFASTPAGRLAGYLKDVPVTTDPTVGTPASKNTVISIEAGTVGCPAMTP